MLPLVFRKGASGLIQDTARPCNLQILSHLFSNSGLVKRLEAITPKGAAVFTGVAFLSLLAGFLLLVPLAQANTSVITVSSPPPADTIAFSGPSATIIKGDTVEWCWADSNCSSVDSTVEDHSTTSGTCGASSCSPSGMNGMAAWDSGLKANGTFSLVFNNSGTYTYYCSLHTISMQGSFIVAPYDSNNPTHYQLIPSTGTPTAGVAFTIQLLALDRNNNQVQNYSGHSATLSNPTGSGAVFSPNPVTVNFGTNAVTLNATLQTSGNQQISVTDGTISGSVFVNVQAGPATHFAVTAPPTGTAGQNTNFAVTAQDQFNNTAPTYAGTVHFTSSDGAAVPPADSTLVNGGGGFGIVFNTPGTQTIVATDTVTNSITGSTSVLVNSANCPDADKTFTNSAAITINDVAPATPFPSSITVSGLNGRVVGKVTVTLSGYQHTYSSDVDILLVGPGGQEIVLMNDAGIGEVPLNPIDITFDDAAAATLPQFGPFSGGNFKPTSWSGRAPSFSAPAPVGPYPVGPPNGTASLLSSFAGTDPNGTWSLYVQDNVAGDSGNILNGWSLTITPAFTQTSSTPIQFDNLAATSPYPSPLTVSGLNGNVAQVMLNLSSLTTNCPPELAVMLIGPQGQQFIPMSLSGPYCNGPTFSGINLTLTDASATALPAFPNTLASGVFSPGSYQQTFFGSPFVFPSPAPPGPYTPAIEATPDGTATFGSLFNGIDPNGTWNLYVQSQSQLGPPAGTGQFAGGWGLTFILKCPTPTSCGVTSTTNPSSFNQSTTFTTTVTSGAGTPFGNVTFMDGASPIASNVALDGAGQATFSTSALAVGSHNISVAYAGNTTFDVSSSPPVIQVVNQATTVTVIASSVNPTTYNQATIFTAKVTPAFGGLPTGTVTFTDTTLGMVLGTVPLNPLLRGILTYSALAVGTHNITATYNGDANYTGSTSPVKVQVVNKAPSSSALMSSLNPSTFGAAVALTATISSTNGVTPTGTVNFMEGATMLGSGTLSSSQTGILISTLSVGVHNLTAVYLGDGNFVGSTSPVLVQTVNRAATTTTVTSGLNPSTFGQTVTFNANVTSSGGTATGTVTFLDGATTLGTANLVNHRGSFTTSALTGGTHSITVAYSGDTSFAPSTSSVLMQGVNRAATTASLTANRTFIHFRQGSTVTITLTSGAPGTPTGTVTFSDNGVAFASLSLVNGAAGGTPLFGKLGLHAITVTYNGDTNFAPSSSNEVDIYKSARPHGNPPLPSEN